MKEMTKYKYPDRLRKHSREENHPAELQTYYTSQNY